MNWDNSESSVLIERICGVSGEEKLIAELQESDRELLDLANQEGEQEKLLQKALDFLNRCEALFPELGRLEHKLEISGLADFWAAFIQAKTGHLLYVDLKPSPKARVWFSEKEEIWQNVVSSHYIRSIFEEVLRGYGVPLSLQWLPTTPEIRIDISRPTEFAGSHMCYLRKLDRPYAEISKGESVQSKAREVLSWR